MAFRLTSALICLLGFIFPANTNAQPTRWVNQNSAARTAQWLEARRSLVRLWFEGVSAEGGGGKLSGVD